MKAFVQWTQADPLDYREIDSSQWGALARKPVPVGGEVVDNAPGWMMDCNIQGISLGGADHYDLRDLADGSGGAVASAWWDDAGDLPPAQFHAEVWTLLPYGPDARLGGAINTRQSRIIYAAPGFLAKLNPNMENTVVRPWSEFVPPAGAIHGISVSNASLADHEQKQSLLIWQQWTEGLDPRELDVNGWVRSQRRQGRYNKPTGTITYFLHDTDLASGVHAAAQIGNENEMEETDVAIPVNQRHNATAGVSEIAYIWTTLAGSPNDADWPNGAYRCQMDVSGVMNLVNGYGLLTLSGVVGHFARVNAGLTADQETWQQDEEAFTGTGIKLATHTINPGVGAADERFECVCVADGVGDSMNGRLDLRHDDSDSFADGPWTAAAADENIDVKHASDPVMEVF